MKLHWGDSSKSLCPLWDIEGLLLSVSTHDVSAGNCRQKQQATATAGPAHTNIHAEGALPSIGKMHART